MGLQLELIDESGKIQKNNVWDVGATYQVDELIKCLPDQKAFGCATKCQVHLKITED